MLEPGGRKQGSTRRNRRVATGELPQTQLAKGRDACRALARPSPKSEEPRTPQPFAARKRLQKELPERELSGDLRPAEITPPYRPGNTLLPTSKGKNRAVIKSWGGGGNKQQAAASEPAFGELRTKPRRAQKVRSNGLGKQNSLREIWRGSTGASSLLGDAIKAEASPGARARPRERGRSGTKAARNRPAGRKQSAGGVQNKPRRRVAPGSGNVLLIFPASTSKESRFQSTPPTAVAFRAVPALSGRFVAVNFPRSPSERKLN